jgi:hypothetical protein
VYTSVYLGHLTGYGILLSRLNEMHTEHLGDAIQQTATP